MSKDHDESVNLLLLEKKIRKQWCDAQTPMCIQRMMQTLGMWVNSKPQLELFY